MDGSENLPLDLPPSTRNMKNIIIDGETRKIYLGTSDGLFRTNILTGISNEKENLIDRFVLEQNYPNPFNPITTITYQIPKTSFVTIKVYDVLGNEIATLVNEELEAGKYEIDFIARDLPSGIYFYTFRSGSFAETKKMLLLK
ncbi:MAG: T9SS type A sorting domain-containing protein [Bacteroidetes bacterium]|nr:T9SS type A sorting domain-containing protein [Bacteroidota bacterium]